MSGFRGSKDADMRSYNISEAKTQLSKLVERAAKGESFVIAKAGEADGEGRPFERAGILWPASRGAEDFNTMGAKEILKQFRRRK